MSPPIMPTRILIVGSGGREHALAWKLANEPGVNDVFVADGPAASAMLSEARVRAIAFNAADRASVIDAARRVAAELVVIGPEAPLAAGLADALAEAGISVFGPTADAARIESSKAFCRDVATAAGVPMPKGRAFAVTDPAAAMACAIGLGAARRGVVVKADGLAAGKGVTVCDTADEAAIAIAGQPGAMVIEERLTGREASVIAICDGREAVALPAARDHKRLLDGDRGPNTGGMGAYSPLPDLSDHEVEDVVERFHRPVLRELAGRGTPFRGALYAGLMLTNDGPRLLEFNARFGDPEAQVILPRLAMALGPLLLAAARGRLAAVGRIGGSVPALPGAAVGIVLASAGYPGEVQPGSRIPALDAEGRLREAPDVLVFHSGTVREASGDWLATGGRVVTLVGAGSDLEAARGRAEAAAGWIAWPGAQRRHDIAAPPAALAGARA